MRSRDANHPETNGPGVAELVGHTLIGVLDKLPVAVAVTDEHTRLLFTGGALSRHPRGERPAPAQSLAEFLGVDHDDEVLKAHASALTGETVVYRTWWHERWWEATATPWYHQAEVAGVVYFAIDVTDQVQAGLLAESTRATFTTFLDHAPLRASLRDGQGRFVWINELLAGEQAPESMIGRRLRDYHSPEASSVLEACDEKVLATGSPMPIQLSMAGRDGRTRHVSGLHFAVPQAELRPGQERSSPMLGAVYLDVTDEVEQRQARERAEQRFASFMHHAPIMAAVRDSTGRYVWANRLYAGDFGFDDPEDIVGLDPHEVMKPPYAEIYLEEDARILREGVTLPVVDLASHDGAPRHASGVKFRIPHPHLPHQFAVGIVIMETTEWVRAQEAFEARFATFMDNLPAFSVIKDEDGRYLWVNRAHRLLFGRTDADVLGRTAAELDTPEDAAVIEAQDTALLADGVARWVRFTTRTSAGRAVHAQGWRFTFTDTDGSRRIGGSFEDVTERTELARRVEETEKSFIQLYEHAGMPIVTYNLDGTIRDCNAAFAAMMGYARSELHGLHVNDLVSKATMVKDEGRWREVVEGRSRSYRSRVCGRRRDGSPVYSQTTTTLIRDRSGRPDFLYSIVDPLIIEDDQHASTPLPTEVPPLGHAESVILMVLSAGNTLKDAGTALCLSTAGVNHHLVKLREKLGLPAATRTGGVVARGYALGLLAPGTWPPVYVGSLAARQD